jgi:Ca-activated chloride channel family protein
MLHLAWPWMLVALPLPALVAWLVPPSREQPGSGLRVPFHHAVRDWRGGRRDRAHRARVALAILAWLALVGAACRPQWVGEPTGLAVSGRDLLLAVDVSASMRTRDLEQAGQGLTRMYIVKTVAAEFIARRAGDRVGLILFGTRAYVQIPLTFDRRTVNALLQDAVPGVAGDTTAIGDAIGLAVRRLRQRPEATRVLVLLTDGANTAGEVEPLAAARLAARAGVRIHTIGVGAEAMLEVRRESRDTVNPSADLDEQMLRDVAAVTGGRYFRGRDRAEVESIYRELDAIEPVVQDAERLRPSREVFHWPLAAALLLAIAPLLRAALRRAGRPRARPDPDLAAGVRHG